MTNDGPVTGKAYARAVWWVAAHLPPNASADDVSTEPAVILLARMAARDAGDVAADVVAERAVQDAGP